MVSMPGIAENVTAGTFGETEWMLWDEDMEKYMLPLCDLLCVCEE